MGLTAKAQSAVSTVQITPVVVRTSNVAKELLQTAANYKIPVQKLDFEILEIQTFCRKEAGEEDEEWIELSQEEIRDIEEDLLLNPHFELKQVYEIEIHEKSKELLAGMDMSIGGSPTLAKVYLTIKAGSVAHYLDGFGDEFILCVRKKMLRANIMVGIFDSMMEANLRELLAKIQVQGVYKFENAERYLIAQAYEPLPTIDDRLVLHFEAKRQNEDEHGRIDYAKRGYVISVVENELLIEYVKPKMGENGRNCRGEFITPKDPLIRFEPTFGVGENIEIVNTPDTIEYRAKMGGYVTYEGGIYDIRTEVEVSEISFKTTGSIDTQLDADVAINVKEKDSLKDAIGPGMEVKVHTINVEGNVGANAKITAQSAHIHGQVHQSAFISAEELKVNILKGTAQGKKIHVTRLEHGTIEGDEVFVSQATGGKIRAKEITIETLGSHVKIYASFKIEIEKLVGGENILVIDPTLSESAEELAERAEKMEQTKRAIHEVGKELTYHEQLWRENIPSMEDLKQKLARYKSSGVKIPAALVQKYQQFQHLKEKIETLQDELKTKKEQYEWFAQKHIALQGEILNARVINHGIWKNHNEVIFKLIDPPIEVVYVPHEEAVEKYLGLEQDENGEYVIKVMNK